MEAAPPRPTPLDVDPERRAEAFRALRGEGGLVPFPGLSGIVAAVTYEAVDAGLRSVNNFVGSAGSDGIPNEDRMISGMEEPLHGKVRRIINSVVAIHRSQKIEPFLEDLAARLVDGMLREASEGPVDLIAHLAEPIPPIAMAKLFGFPEEDARSYYGWIRESGIKFQEAASQGRSIAIEESSEGLSAYVAERIEERLARPQAEWPEDALTRFLTTDVDGERLSLKNIKAQIMFMIGAGAETTRNTIGNLFYRLGCDPATYAALRADRSLLDDVIEETLRIDPPAQWMVRTCTQPIELGGQFVESGQRVFMCIGSGNRDEGVHEAPDEFRIDRESYNHLAFGSGPHVCPGAPLARMEIRAAVRAFLDRVESYRLAEPGYDALPTAMLQGPRTLHIVVSEERA